MDGVVQRTISLMAEVDSSGLWIHRKLESLGEKKAFGAVRYALLPARLEGDDGKPYSLGRPPLGWLRGVRARAWLLARPAGRALRRRARADEPRSAECDRKRTAPWLPFDSEVCERRPDSDPEGDGECFS